MYWYMPRQDPHQTLHRVAQLRATGEFDKLPDPEKLKIAKELDAMALTAGKHLYICKPDQQLYKWFLQPHKIKGAVAGNRAGKTAAGAIEIIMQAEGWHPLQRKNLQQLAEEAELDWVREHCQRLLKEKRWIKDPPIRARVVAVDFDNAVDKVIGPEFKSWLSHDLVESIEFDHEKRRSIKWKNVSVIEFLTLKQDLEAHMGAARDVILCDEEPYEHYWKENLLRTTSTRGRMLLTMTAVNGTTWTKDTIWEPGFKGKNNIFCIQMSTRENPINTEEMVQEIEDQIIDPVERAIRIDGDIVARGGNVFKMYRDEEPWIVPEFDIPETGLMILSIDPHPKTPHGLTWVWVDFEGLYHPLHEGRPNLYLVAGLFAEGHVPYVSGLIEAKEGFLQRKHDICICDPAGWISNQAEYNAKSFASQLEDNGIYPLKGSKDLMGGIVKMGEMLSLQWKGNSVRERPQLMVFDTGEGRDQGVGRFRWEMKNYRWPSPALSSRSQNAPVQKPVDKDDHLIEATRRICEYVYDQEYDNFDSSDLLFGNIKLKQNGVELLFPEQPKENQESAFL